MKPSSAIPILLLAALRLFAAAPTFTYSLSPGWNLLGCTLEWNAQSRQKLALWNTIALPAGPHHAYRQNATAAAPGEAFWLFNPGDATTLTLSGDLTGWSPRLQHGWTFLGVPASFDRADYPAILHAYEWRGGRFHEATGTLHAGHGYWLYCEEISPTAGTLQATQLNAEGRNTLRLTTTGFSDNTGIAGYHIYLDDTLIATANAQSLAEWELDLAPAVTGQHALAVVAFDSANNTSARITIPVTIQDLIPPAAGAVQAAQLLQLDRHAVAITTDGFTDNAAVTAFEIRLGNRATQTVALSALDQWPLDLAEDALGDQTVAVRALDAAGNASAWVETTVAIQSTTPAYLVIDLSGGPRAASYPVRFAENAPNPADNACRTTELWLRRIPAGVFVMGSPAGERGRDDDTDHPRHTVTISRPFYLGVFEFTQAQWELVMDYNPSRFPGPLHPVERVTYDMLRGGKSDGAGWPAKGHAVDRGSFLAILRARTGLAFDLPTEAQWEYACRAGTDTALNSGANLAALEQDAGLALLAQYRAATPVDVGSFAPNAWGLYDTHGNAAEWCLDWNGGIPADATDPVGPATGQTRILRGGNWTSVAARCRAASRAALAPGLADATGFRIALIP